MALQIAPFSLLTPASAGAVPVTGIGFQAKGAVVFGERGGSQGLGAAFRIGYDDFTNHAGHAFNAGNFFGGQICEHQYGTSYSMHGVRAQALNQQIYYGYLHSPHSDGFIAQFDHIRVGGGVTIHGVAIGGDGINCQAGYWEYGASGAFSIATLPWQPRGIIGSRVEAVAVPILNGTGGESDINVGFASDIECGQAGCSAWAAATSINTGYYQRDGEWLVSSGAVDQLRNETVLTSFDPTGFSGTNTLSGIGRFHPYLAVNGCAVNVVAFNQKLTTGEQSVPITAGSPVYAFIMGANKPTNASLGTDLLFSFGAGDVASQKCVWTGLLDGTLNCNTATDLSHIIIAHTPTGNFASTLNSRAALTGLSPGVMTLNWDLVNGVANEWIALIFANDLGTGPCGALAPVQCVPTPPTVPDNPASPVGWGAAVTPGGGIIV